jgi:hypothetical protein
VTNPAVRIGAAIERFVLGWAKFRIVSTQGMHLVFRFRRKQSFLIMDAAGDNFHPRPGSRQSAFARFSLPEAALLFGVPVHSESEFRMIVKAADQITSERKVCFALFAKRALFQSIQKSVATATTDKVVFYVLPMNTDEHADVLAGCDWGICLRRSRYGLDISPELTQMVASEIRIIAPRKGCVSDVVKDGISGCLFNDVKELPRIIDSVIDGQTAKLGVARTKKWQNEWDRFYAELIQAKPD